MSHREPEHSDMRGHIHRGGVVYVWDIAADAYVPLRRTGQPAENDQDRRPEHLDTAGVPDPDLGALEPDDLPRRLKRTVYADRLSQPRPRRRRPPRGRRRPPRRTGG